jgi:WD40 repeat protein
VTLVVFLTDGALLEPHVKAAVYAADRENKHVVGMYEGDFAREGAVMDQGRWGRQQLVDQVTGDPKLRAVLDLDCTKFEQTDRNTDKLRVFAAKIAQKSKCPFLIDLPDTYDPFARALKKASELEPGTREWITQEFVRECQTKNACFLLSNAGMGKSVIMGSMVGRGCALATQAHGGVPELGVNIVAAHFFNHADESRGVLFALKSLARQMCSSVPGFRQGLGESKSELDEKIKECNGNCGALLDLLVVQPLAKLEGAGKLSKRLVVVLDALDECEKTSEMVRAIASVWDKAPKQCVLLASSRPQDVVKSELEKFGPFYLEPGEEQNQRDLREFVKHRLEKRLGVADDAVVDALVAQSQGVFLWLAFQQETMYDLASKGELTVDAVRALPGGMGETYKLYFGRFREAIHECGDLMRCDADKDNYDEALALALLVGRTDMPERVWQRALGFDPAKPRDVKQYAKVRAAASSLLLFGGSDGVILAPHKSMSDWLLGIGEACAEKMGCMDLAVHPRPEHHRTLAETLEQIARECRVPDWEVHVESREERFAFGHVVHHWMMADETKEAFRWVTMFRLLFRVVAQAVEDRDYLRCSGDVASLVEKCDAELRPMVKLVRAIVNLAETAVMDDPRHLAGQALGRVGAPPYNYDVEIRDFVAGSQEWIARARSDGQLKFVLPVLGRSGLQNAGGSLVRVLEHSAGVNCLAVTEVGGRVFTGSRRIAQIWNVESGKCVKVLEGHTGSVDAISCTPDGKLVFTGSSDKSVRIWEAESGKCLLVLKGQTVMAITPKKSAKGHTEGVSAIACTPDGQWLFSGSRDKTARIWNAKSGECRHTLEGHDDVVYTISCVSDGSRVFTGSSGTFARIWDSASGICLRTLESPSWVKAIACTPDGQRVLTGSSDGSVRVWDTESGTCLSTFEGHHGPVNAIACTADGKRVFSGSEDLTARIWDVDSGKCLLLQEEHTKPVVAITCTSDGLQFFTASRDKTVRISDALSGKCVHKLEEHSDVVSAIACTPDCTLVFSASGDCSARIWDVRSGICLQTLRGHEDMLLAISCTPDGKRVFSGSYDKTARVWDAVSGNCLQVLVGHRNPVGAVACTPDGRLVFTGSFDTTARIWVAENGECLQILKEHFFAVRQIACTQDGKMVFTCAGDTVKIWETETGVQLRSLQRDSDEARGLFKFQTLQSDPIKDCVSFYFDSDILTGFRSFPILCGYCEGHKAPYMWLVDS